MIRRAAGAAGGYLPNRFLIILEPEHALLRKDGTMRADATAAASFVFIHEYVHYLLNISTASGFKSFSIYQRLVALFSHTLDPITGASRGSEALTERQRETMRQLLRYADYCDGEECPASVTAPDEEAVGLEVLGLDADTHDVDLPDGLGEVTSLNLMCRVTLPNGTTPEVDFIFGATAIEKGLAYEIDRMVEASEVSAPPFPYRVLREVARKVGPDNISRTVLVSVALLALQTADPPRALVRMLDHLRELKRESGKRVASGEAPYSSKEMLNELVQATRGQRRQALDVVRSDFKGLIEMHDGRGLCELAMRHLAGLAERILARRLDNPLWDVRPFDQNVTNRMELARVLSSVAPCDVLERHRATPGARDPELERDWLVRHGVVAASEEPAFDAVRALQCQLEFVLAHVTDDERFATSDSASAQAQAPLCPFFTSCNLALRKNHAEVCRTKPWEIVRHGSSKSCWYGIGAQALNHRTAE